MRPTTTDTSAAARDNETRERLRATAGHLFAEHGFKKVTVRDISAHANVNLAAVSYHYGDKLGLYNEVVRAAIEAMRALNDQSMDYDRNKSPQDRLRHYVHTYLPRLADPDAHTWIHKLMRHELNDPTPLAKKIVSEAIMPRIQFLEALVAEMLHCETSDPRVQGCVMSIQAQCLFFIKTSFRTVVANAWQPRTPIEVQKAADHVAEFSIAGIEALARRARG